MSEKVTPVQMDTSWLGSKPTLSKRVQIIISGVTTLWKDNALETVIPSPWNINPPLSSTPTLLSPSPELSEFGPNCLITKQLHMRVSRKPWTSMLSYFFKRKTHHSRVVSSQPPIVAIAELYCSIWAKAIYIRGWHSFTHSFSAYAASSSIRHCIWYLAKRLKCTTLVLSVSESLTHT